MSTSGPVKGHPARTRVKWIGYGFLLAGGYNILGILLFSQLFTNGLISSLYPQVFSSVGMLGILLWGAAYASVYTCYERVLPLIGVFAIEKLLYVWTWIFWLTAHAPELKDIAEISPMTALFYLVYGVGDLLSAAFFMFVIFLVWRDRKAA